MNEDTDQATARDVMQSSALTARLLRRLTASPGIIDVQMLRQIPARPMGLLASLVSMFDDLMARYGIDDGSKGNQPLIMGQPWMQKVHAYLTTYSSFSSTTNEFISIAAAAQQSTAEIERMKDERMITDVESPFIHPSSLSTPGTGPSKYAPNPAASSTPLDEASTSSRVETFRVSRRPARRAWESDLTAAAPINYGYQTDAREKLAVSEKTSLKSRPADQTEGEKLGAVAAHEKIEPTKVSVPSVAAPGDLLPAQAQVQRKLPDDRAEPGSAPANQTAEVKKTGGPLQPVPAKTNALTQTLLTAVPRNRSAEDGHTAAKQSKGLDKKAGMRPKDVSREIVDHSFLGSNLESLDLVPAASSQLQKRATDFVWRRSGDIPTVRELASIISGARQKAVADPLVQSPRSSQTITPKSMRRKGEPGAGSRLTTERIVRNISRKLLIERERRGY